MVYRVGIYARKSIDEEKKGNGNESILTQISMLERYVETHAEFQLLESYVDNGVTGTRFDRPEFNRLMEDVRCGHINCVIVKDLSRFGRNYLEAGKLLEVIFPCLNVRFIAINDGYDSHAADCGERQFNAALNNLVNDSYAKDISKAINAVYRENFKCGSYMAPYAAYGYVRSADDPHKLEIDEEVAEHVRLMFGMRADGRSYQEIADYMNRNNIESPSNYKYRKGILKDKRFAKPCLWGADYIGRLLMNPVYIGAVAQGRQQCRNATGGKAVRVPKENWYVKEHMHPAIISDEVWQKAQDRKKADMETYARNDGKYKRLAKENILKGKLLCSLCGKPLRRGHQYYKGKLLYNYYCVTRDKNGEKCANRYQSEEKLFGVIMKAVHQQIQVAVDTKKLLAELSAMPSYNRQEQALQAQLQTVEREQKKLTVKKANLYADYCDGVITKEDYRLLAQRYEEQASQATAQIEDLTVRLYRQKTMAGSSNLWLTEFERFRRKKKLTKEVVDALIDKIYVHSPYELEIVFRYRDEYLYLMQEMDRIQTGGISV
ncbi:MAG: recombinase family protein [Clostridia bacterium]|nr:recombinase family protein [Clostridia bacterium]